MKEEREKRTHILQVRITPTQRRLLEREAIQSDLSISQVARGVINDYLKKQHQDELVAA